MKNIFCFSVFFFFALSLHAQTDTLRVKKASAPVEEEPVFMVVDETAEFPGGDGAFRAYLAKNIVYPDSCKQKMQQGTVYISFVIEKDGSCSNFKTVKSVTGAPALAEEATRVLKAMPRWKPGKMQGRPVRMQIVIPVKFKLD